MNCNVCSGKGKIEIERFGRTSVHVCYLCEGAGKIKQCTFCNGSGEKIIEAKNGFEFSPCLICVGNGVIPLIENCECNGKGYIWVQVGYDEPEWEQTECNCYRGSE